MKYKTLFLFDIDNTLMKTPKIHDEALNIVFKKVYGVDANIDMIEHSGKCDIRIIKEVLEKVGISADEIEQKMEEAIEVATSYFIKNFKKKDVILLPGSLELVKKLFNNNVLLGIVSGNLRGIGERKLELAGLSKYFKVKAFGSESYFKSELVKLALERAKEIGFVGDKNSTFLIGDTPYDAMAAKENGIKFIGVLTGRYREDRFREFKPFLLVKSLKDIKLEKLLK